MTKISPFLAIVVLLATGMSVLAQQAAKPVDPRVERALRAMEYKYAVTPLGNCKVSFTLEGGRGHLVFISSSTEKFGTLETRKVWATVMKSKGLLSQEVANKLLMDNIPMKLGAYELTKVDEGGYKVMFAARVDANCPPAALKDVLRIVLVTADAKEQELTNADEF